jgi:uncharacterized circularly permuted ATP-grasp superfamily protein
VPVDLVLGCPDYRREIFGVNTAKNVYTHISAPTWCATKGRVFSTRRQLRSPSGACYVVENRQVMKNTFP